MNLNFLLSGVRTFFYSFKKKESDELIKKARKIKSDYVILGLNGSVLNYYNCFLPMQRFFYKRKIKFIPIPYDYTGEPETICKEIVLQIKKYLSHKKVILVGHSYGGMLARNVVTKYLKDNSKFHIITVATPNLGVDITQSNIFDRLLYKYVGLMQPELKESKMIKYLEKNPLKCRINIIVGGRDSLVPEEYAAIGVKKPDIVLANEDHLSIVYSKALFCVIKGLVKNIKND